MSRTVKCVKYKEELEGLDAPPYPNDLGKRIFENVSKKAWDDWMEYQTKLINELHLKIFEPKAQEVILKHAEEFFFGEAPKMPE